MHAAYFFASVSVWDYSLLSSLSPFYIVNCHRNTQDAKILFSCKKSNPETFRRRFFSKYRWLCCDFPMLTSISHLSSRINVPQHTHPRTLYDSLIFFPGASERNALMCNCIRNSGTKLPAIELFISLTFVYDIPPACSPPNEPNEHFQLANFYFLLRFIPGFVHERLRNSMDAKL